jgi:hypothetical protein
MPKNRSRTSKPGYMKQHDRHSCAPIAICNMIKWAQAKGLRKSRACSRTQRKLAFRNIYKACRTNRNVGTCKDDTASVLASLRRQLNIIATYRNYLRYRDCRYHLRAGGSIIVSRIIKSSDGREHGHAYFIDSYTSDGATVVNFINGQSSRQLTHHQFKQLFEKRGHVGWLITPDVTNSGLLV